MVQIQEISRTEAIDERSKLEARFLARYETDSREVLRELSLSGEMSASEVEKVERLRTLDYLLGE
jgi:hypothetical protein